MGFQFNQVRPFPGYSGRVLGEAMLPLVGTLKFLYFSIDEEKGLLFWFARRLREGCEGEERVP